MLTGEKKLFISLCDFQSESFDENLLNYATPAVLGQLFMNRMAAIAYGILKEKKLLNKVNREFRNSLKMAYDSNVAKNNQYFDCLKYLDSILCSSEANYALLKGAVLCKEYPDGYRTSNDVDILVLPEDITEIGDILIKNGFIQGYIRNGVFVPATRKEIIESRMMRGETVPYIKDMGMEHMKYLEVDINFSLDYKNSDSNALVKMLDNNITKVYDGFNVRTLNDIDFFIHLCAHLYKEAATIAWVKMNRDMTIYKYCDIYMLLNKMDVENTVELFKRAKSLGLSEVCAYVVLHTAALFEINNTAAIGMAKDILAQDTDFIHCVISPTDKKILTYSQKDIFERFFMDDRINDLKEVNENEKN